MRNRAFITISLGICLLSLSACGGQLYKVAPLPSDAAPGLSSGTTTNLSVGAVALAGDTALERFEANLPLAGVVAVEVQLANKTSEAINLSTLKFDLKSATGAKLKPLTPKKALGRVMKYYGNSFYALAAREKTRDDYEAVSLKLDGELAPGQERRGMLFFQTDRETASVNGLTLSIGGAAAPIALSLDSR
jgi:hypothetical protein